MILESERFGSIEVDETAVVELQGGLLGFGHMSTVVLMDADETGAYVWVQSTEDPNLAFLAVAPNFFFPGYEPDIPDSEAKEMGLSADKPAQVLCLVTIGEDAITANLLGPIIVNIEDRVARQLVLADQGWTTTERLGLE